MKRIVLITTGGTIASTKNENGGYSPTLSGQQLLEGFSIPDILVEVNNFCAIPGDHFTFSLWIQLAKEIRRYANDPETDGIVVTMGTDAMEDTAYFLDLVFNISKPIVITGSQRQFGDPDTDARKNLRNAISVASSKSAWDHGVLVVMNEEIFSATDFIKIHTSLINGFTGKSGGAIGYLIHDVPHFTKKSIKYIRNLDIPKMVPRVDIVCMYPGADTALIDAAISVGANGLVLQLLGMGNSNQAFLDAVSKYASQDIPIVVSSKLPFGFVQPLYGFAGGGKTLLDAGAIFAGDLPPSKARVLLMICLGLKMGKKEITEHFSQLYPQELYWNKKI